MYGLELTLRRQFGATEFKISTMDGFAKFQVHAPNTVDTKGVHAAMVNSNYTMKRITITRPGQEPVVTTY